MATPDYDQWLNSVWGWPTDSVSDIPNLVGVNGIRPPGLNPPLGIVDFLQIYPKFFGASIQLAIETRTGSASVASVPTNGVGPAQLILAPGIVDGSAITACTLDDFDGEGDFTATLAGILNLTTDTDGMLVGQPIAGPLVAAGATLKAVGTSTLTMSAPAIATATAAGFTVTLQHLRLTAPATASAVSTATVYTTPPVPLAVINVYLNLARASLDAVRWGEVWQTGVFLYAAHFITLWMQSESGTFTNAAAIARRGITAGLMVSKSADGLSASYAPLTGLQDWGAWNLTGYGQQLATWAAVIGSGSMLIY